MIDTLDNVRVLAALTGLVIVALAFIQLLFGKPLLDILPTLATTIAGFELGLFANEQFRKRTSRNG